MGDGAVQIFVGLSSRGLSHLLLDLQLGVVQKSALERSRSVIGGCDLIGQPALRHPAEQRRCRTEVGQMDGGEQEVFVHLIGNREKGPALRSEGGLFKLGLWFRDSV